MKKYRYFVVLSLVNETGFRGEVNNFFNLDNPIWSIEDVDYIERMTLIKYQDIAAQSRVLNFILVGTIDDDSTARPVQDNSTGSED